MKKKLVFFILFFLGFSILTGCWDSKELSDQAFVLGMGADLTKEGKFIVSSLIVLPAALGSSQAGGGGQAPTKPFLVEKGNGKTVSQAQQNLQLKLSRTMNRRQRQTIFFGESFAKRGIGEYIELVNRDPEAPLKGDLIIVKGKKAFEMLKLSYPLEYNSAIASLNIHKQIDHLANNTIINFLITKASQATSPTLPVIEMGEDQKTLRYSGSAIIDKKLKLVGYLNEDETKDKMWIDKSLSQHVINAESSKGKGKVNLKLVELKSTIIPIIKQNKVKFKINLYGRGEVTENNTNFDLTKPENVEIVEQELEKYCEKHVFQTIQKVQKKYGTDIFGFGDAIFRKKSSQWKKLRNNWDQEFSEAEIMVSADLNVQMIGLTRTSESAVERK